MDQQEIRSILEQVAQGKRSVDEAVLALKMEPFKELGFAKVDNHRGLRQRYRNARWQRDGDLGKHCHHCGKHSHHHHFLKLVFILHFHGYSHFHFLFLIGTGNLTLTPGAAVLGNPS